MKSQLFEHNPERGVLDWGNPDPAVVDHNQRVAEGDLDGTWRDKKNGQIFVHMAGRWTSGNTLDDLFDSLGPLHMEDLERVS